MIREIGKTPLISLRNLTLADSLKCSILAKLEYMNPTGSSADRLIKDSLIKAPKELQGNKGVIITNENTSTELSAAWASSMLDIHPFVISDKNLPHQRSNNNGILPLLSEYNICDNHQLNGNNIAMECGPLFPAHVHIKPTSNPSSIQGYYDSIGSELSGQRIDMLVCGGEDDVPGGLLQALDRRLRVGNPKLITIGVNFQGNSFRRSNTHNIDLSKAADVKWKQVSDPVSFLMTRKVAHLEGLSIGPLSGAVVAVALNAIREEGKGNDPNFTCLLILNGGFHQYSTTAGNFLDYNYLLSEGHLKEENMECIYWWWEMNCKIVKAEQQWTISDPLKAEKGFADRNKKKKKISLGTLISSDEDNKIMEGVLNKGVMEVLKRRLPKMDMKKLISFALNKRFKEIYSDDKLSVAYDYFKSVDYLPIYHSMKVLNHKEKDDSKIHSLVGIMTFENWLKNKFVSEVHHRKHYGIGLTDGYPNSSWFQLKMNGVSSVFPTPIVTPTSDSEQDLYKNTA